MAPEPTTTGGGRGGGGGGVGGPLAVWLAVGRARAAAVPLEADARRQDLGGGGGGHAYPSPEATVAAARAACAAAGGLVVAPVSVRIGEAVPIVLDAAGAKQRLLIPITIGWALAYGEAVVREEQNWIAEVQGGQRVPDQLAAALTRAAARYERDLLALGGGDGESPEPRELLTAEVVRG